MRFERIKVRGLGPFRDDVEVDLRALDARVVAVTGDNGAGKSTLLELLAGALYRQCPTRGSLASLATRRDAMLEAHIANGQSYTVRQLVDSHTGKGEAVALDHEGRPLFESARVREFDSWANRHIIPPEVLYSSTFAVQGSGGFLELKPADRKRVLLRVLGIERLEAMADRARDRARAAKGEFRTLTARIEDASGSTMDVEEAAAELALARERVREADEVVESATAKLAALREEAKSIDERAQELRAVEERRRSLKDRVDELDVRAGEVEYRVSDLRKVLAQSEDIRAALGRDNALEEEAEYLAERIAGAREELDQARAEYAKSLDVIRSVEGRIRDARRDAQEARRALEGADEVDAAIRGLPKATEDLKSAQQHEEQACEALRRAREELIHGKDRRVNALRTGLSDIARTEGATAEEHIERAEDSIREDDEAAARQQALPDTLAELEARLESAEKETLSASKSVQRLEGLAERADRIREARGVLARAQSDEVVAEEELRDLKAQREEADAELAKLEQALENAGALADANREGRQAIAHLVRRADELTRAEARLEELEPEAKRLREEYTSARAELGGLPAPADLPNRPDTAQAEKILDHAQRGAREAHAALAVAHRQAEQAREVEDKLKGLREECTRVEHELADWTRLSQDLGRDGIQALEIDAAGPELTELVNDLLHQCVSRRFTVTIQTTRLSADGKRELEGCEVVVTDTERGREAEASTFSGGERVIIGEAVSLALSVLACRRAGVDRPTLIRDESGAALDPDNGRAYVAMLRRAADLIGADKVLFVSHTPELQELADARIHIVDGRVEVQS